MGALRFSFESQKPRFKKIFACGALFRGCFLATFLLGFFPAFGIKIIYTPKLKLRGGPDGI